MLRSHIESGVLPRAPIATDVRDLDATWLKRKPDIIVGGFPCVGFSEMGRREGFDDNQSGLFSEILRLADATGCPMLFLENVPGVLYLGMPDIVRELVTKRGFELQPRTGVPPINAPNGFASRCGPVGASAGFKRPPTSRTLGQKACPPGQPPEAVTAPSGQRLVCSCWATRWCPTRCDTPSYTSSDAAPHL